MLAQIASKSATKADTAALPLHTLPHGQRIFVFRQWRTNQVLYSLTRILAPRALKQLPNLGKKTVPPGLRKDLWQPFVQLTFSHPLLGLIAYRKLREFRKRHELEYPLSDITYTSGPRKGYLMSRKDRGKALMDQKANTVADIAAVLLAQATPPDPEKLNRLLENKKATERNRWFKARFTGRKGIPDREKGLMTLKWAEMKGPVEVLWRDISDKDYAAQWPDTTSHGVLQVHRHHLIGNMTATQAAADFDTRQDDSQQKHEDKNNDTVGGFFGKIKEKLGRRKDDPVVVE